MNIVQQHKLTCDVLVAGGGLAGVACALAAARCGSNVILCQDRPVLGGNASSEVRMHIVGADGVGSIRGAELATEAREGGIVEEVRLEASVRNPQRSASMFDLILYEKCRAESNLILMLNTTVTGAELKNTRITHAIADRPSTEDKFRIAARIFVDCTGDGRLGVEAGAPFRCGRESRKEFSEPSAQPRSDNKHLGSTLLFQARKYDKPMPFIAPSWARNFTESDLMFRPHATSGEDTGLAYGYWWVEWGGHIDTIKDNETIRDELLAIMLGVWNHIKNGGDHGAENWALEWFGFFPGKRESRRFIGQYVLRESDLIDSQPFDDAIAYGGWPIDTHPPEGIDVTEQSPCNQHMVEYLYDIPLRSCVSCDISNLMFAGRNISATHVAFASTRVMATCGVIGQGVGTAAACAIKFNLPPSELAKNSEVMDAVQQRLLRDDTYLIGRVNEDPDDLARSAKIISSSEQLNGRATNVISGQTRTVHGPNGAPPDRAKPGTHRWMSNPAFGLPVWLELRWDKPVLVGRVQLIFDTGLHRMLTMLHSDADLANMVYGRAQPETVRDYIIEGRYEGIRQVLVKVKGNYQRRRIHTFKKPIPAGALRIIVHSTNGSNHARICEVRVYESQKHTTT